MEYEPNPFASEGGEELAAVAYRYPPPTLELASTWCRPLLNPVIFTSRPEGLKCTWSHMQAGSCKYLALSARRATISAGVHMK